MSVKGSWTRVKKVDQFERNRVRAYTDTGTLLNQLGDRIRELGGNDDIKNGYMQALALRSAITLDKPDDNKLARRLILDLHKKLDEKES